MTRVRSVFVTGCSAVLLFGSVSAPALANAAGPRPRWVWSEHPNASIDLSPGARARFGQTQRRVVYDDGPQMPWTEIQPVGICRVRFEGADYLGTLRRGNTRGRVYRWSVTASAFVEAEHAGRGHQCHVRLSSSPNPPETGVATFQQFEYLDAPARTLTDYDPDAPLFARALPLGAQRRRPLYACRVERRYDRPKDTTLGKKTLRKDIVWGYVTDAGPGCMIPDVASPVTIGVRVLGR